MPTAVVPVVAIVDAVVMPVIVPIVGIDPPARTRESRIEVPIGPIPYIHAVTDVDVVADINVACPRTIPTTNAGTIDINVAVIDVVSNAGSVDIGKIVVGSSASDNWSIPSNAWTIPSNSWTIPSNSWAVCSGARSLNHAG